MTEASPRDDGVSAPARTDRGPWLIEGSRRSTIGDVRDCAQRLAGNWSALIAPGRLIASLIHRGTDAVVVLEAARMIGCPVTFFDRSLPEEQVRNVVMSAGCGLVVASSDDLARTSQLMEGRTPVASASPTEIGGPPRPGEPAAAECERRGGSAPDSPALVVFSSGTTGDPKGVALSRENLIGAGNGLKARHAMGPGDTIGELSSFRFVSPVGSVFASLASGARVAFHDLDVGGTDSLCPFVQRRGVTILTLQAALVRAILSAGVRLHDTNIRSVSVAGEAMFGEDLRRLRAILPAACTIRYVYGSTECAGLGVATFPPDDTIPSGRLSFPIGPHTRILDESLNVVAAGETGQVASVRPTSLGYWNRPLLTAERYVERVGLGNVGSERVFLSGDMGRANGHGTFSLVGRADGQVKIRGVNVELSEVESSLLGHAEVHSAAVVSIDRPSGSVLVAYVVPTAGALPSVATLRRFLADRLPAHKIPSRFFLVDKLPTTPGGKIDRVALRLVSATENERPMKGPHDTVSAGLHAFVLTLLGVEQLSVDDDFFAHGGDSLNAIELAAWASHRFGVSVSVRDVVARPTIEALASLIATDRAENAVPISSKPRKHRALRANCTLSAIGSPLNPIATVVLIAGAGDSVASQRPLALGLARLMDDRVRILAVQGPGLEDPTALERSVWSYARTAAREVMNAAPSGPYVICGHSHGGVVAHELARQIETKGSTVATVALLDSHPPRTTVVGAEPVPLIVRLKVRLARARTEAGERRAIANLDTERERLRRHKGMVFEHQVGTARVHRPGVIASPILVVRAQHEPDDGRFLPWAQLTRSDFQVVSTPGGHASIKGFPYVEGVAEIVVAGIRRSLAVGGDAGGMA